MNQYPITTCGLGTLAGALDTTELQKALEGLTMARDLIKEARDVTSESFVTDYLDNAGEWLDKAEAALASKPSPQAEPEG